MLCGCFLRRCMLFRSILVLFFLRFWLKLKTIVGLGQSLVVIDVVFLVAGLSSIVSARLGFQDLVFGDLTSMLFFIARGWLHGLLISFCLLLSLCSLISMYLSSLITSLVALPFAIFSTPGLDSVFPCVCFVRLEGCLWSQA